VVRAVVGVKSAEKSRTACLNGIWKNMNCRTYRNMRITWVKFGINSATQLNESTDVTN
jgi:hypothetical protein